jgi:hypothetical protein
MQNLKLGNKLEKQTDFSKGRSKKIKITTDGDKRYQLKQRIIIITMEVRGLAAQVSSRHQYLGWQECDGDLKEFEPATVPRH